MKMVDEALFTKMVRLRRDLHKHPELSWQEHRTVQVVAKSLDALGISHRFAAGGSGLIADIPGPSDQPTIALRADLDALPIHEETNLPYASTTPGVMHACGHDAHTAMLLGAAELLIRKPDRATPIRLLFQPAEELGTGASAMIRDNALEGVGAIFGGHVDQQYDVGTLVVTEGAVGASADAFTITVKGRGGHGARPHQTADAVLIASHLVIALQGIVAREIQPGQPAVVTVGQLHAGQAINIIAASATLSGTMRAHCPDVRLKLTASLKRICAGIAATHGVKIELEVHKGTPAVLNPKDMTELAHEAAVLVAGPSQVCRMSTANMGGEDFACYLEHVPGCFVRYGIRTPGNACAPAHSCHFDIDERVLIAGASWLTSVAQRAGNALSERQ